MRQQFVPLSDPLQHGEDYLGAQDIDEVARLCPWASEIIEVDGGWQVFESVHDARTWKNQR